MWRTAFITMALLTKTISTCERRTVDVLANNFVRDSSPFGDDSRFFEEGARIISSIAAKGVIQDMLAEQRNGAGAITEETPDPMTLPLGIIECSPPEISIDMDLVETTARTGELGDGIWKLSSLTPTEKTAPASSAGMKDDVSQPQSEPAMMAKDVRLRVGTEADATEEACRNEELAKTVAETDDLGVEIGKLSSKTVIATVEPAGSNEDVSQIQSELAERDDQHANDTFAKFMPRRVRMLP